MRYLSNYRMMVALAAVCVVCSGCGGGGGGSSPGPGTEPPVSTTLGLQVQAPDIAGKAGQEVPITIGVVGTGTVTTAATDISLSDVTFEPITAGLGTSVAVSGLPDTVAARYKWVDSRTIRVLYVSANGATGGTTLLNVPVKVKSETATTPVLRNTRLNQ